MSGESVMPLPPDVREQVDGLASDYEMVAKSISHTQVAQNPVGGVPGWICEAADAYTSSIQKLGSPSRSLCLRCGGAERLERRRWCDDHGDCP